MNDVVDPPEPPEPSEGGDYIKAKDLKNLPLVVQPQNIGTDIGKDGTDYEYVNCSVWVLDRSGVVNSGTNVRVSWWRAREQLRNILGRFVPCRPVEQPDNSVILVPLKEEARKVAESVIADLKTAPADPGPEPPSDSEPF